MINELPQFCNLTLHVLLFDDKTSAPNQMQTYLALPMPICSYPNDLRNNREFSLTVMSDLYNTWSKELVIGQ